MKKLLPITLAVVALGLAATLTPPTFAQFAQGGRLGRAHGQGGGRMQKLANDLGLSDAQKAQLKPILQSAGQQAKAIKADTSLTPEARKAKMKDLRKSTNQQMMAILTPDQRQKLKAMRRQQRAAKGAKA
jgi:Spy/CpxP family protein refolding chaperone